ncbi:MAG: glycosyltransferase family 2 protein [candidate division FCPU426 bacterium]
MPVPKPKQPMLSIVVPVYNEEANIAPFLQRVSAVLKSLACPYEILFCLDPSSDGTEEAIRRRMEADPGIRLLIFSRRFGQPAATIAGIRAATGDCVIVIDVDLQDPPELIPQMVEAWKKGYDVVTARRRSRKGETLVKEFVSHLGYRLINAVSEIPIPPDTGDFRLMSRRVVESLRGLKETHGFLRGLVAFVGFRQLAIEYDRDERRHGKGNYNRWLGSLKIGMNGVISFSSRPLQFVSLAGFAMAGFGFLLGAWYVAQKFLQMPLSPGLSTTVVVVTFFSGVQLVCLGLMGEYVGRIYDEVKQRPLYIVQEEVHALKSKKPGRKKKG